MAPAFPPGGPTASATIFTAPWRGTLVFFFLHLRLPNVISCSFFPSSWYLDCQASSMESRWYRFFFLPSSRSDEVLSWSVSKSQIVCTLSFAAAAFKMRFATTFLVIACASTPSIALSKGRPLWARAVNKESKIISPSPSIWVINRFRHGHKKRSWSDFSSVLLLDPCSRWRIPNCWTIINTIGDRCGTGRLHWSK